MATGFGKVIITPLCIRFGWRGGHFFPVIFAGISIGYGMAMLTGADPVFCLCACTAALVGGVMRQPLMTVLLLFLCFPVKGIVVMLAAAALGAAVPLPKALRVKTMVDRGLPSVEATCTGSRAPPPRSEACAIPRRFTEPFGNSGSFSSERLSGIPRSPPRNRDSPQRGIPKCSSAF